VINALVDMYNPAEQNNIKVGAKQRFVQLISDASEKDKIGCESADHWTLGFHIDSILNVLGRSLTPDQDQCLYERLVEYKNKPLN